MAGLLSRRRRGTGLKVLEPLREADPRNIGAFRLTGRLGQGAMGVVYLGYRSTRSVAVKVIKAALADDPYFRARFAQELEAIRRVGGFHTAALVDADANAGQPWIATEYVHAPSLLSLIEGHGTVSELGAWWLAAGLADALMHIHSVRLLHRDLKPSNVLVAGDGVRVIDFGISHVGGATGLTTADAALGTLAYMAPEQAKDSRKASEAADVYSLGATLVQAMTGHPPFHAQVVAQRTLDVAPDLTGMPRGRLYDLVTHTLAYEAEDRPTAHDVLEEAMERLLEEGMPTGSQAYPPLPKAFLTDVLERQTAPLDPPPATPSLPAPPAPRKPERRPLTQTPAADPPIPPQQDDPWSERWRGRINKRRGDYGG
ncbi:serine/threonine-protein kinase [Streptomyces sp. NPDC050743]|uniref:serine/threonine-protein kinase n=1 Tax=Streptomyces sp. NPDC050743 TaxID=3365634 RepID=UPI0037A0BC77